MLPGFFTSVEVSAKHNSLLPLVTRYTPNYTDGDGNHFTVNWARKSDAMVEEFVSEAIQPVSETIDTARMTRGEPGLPREFRWRSEVVRITQVHSTWRETGPCRHGSGEQYVRKHWFEVSTDSGMKMKIYFERQSRSANKKNRWWLFSIESP